MTDFEKETVGQFHKLFKIVADEVELDLDGSEYSEFGVSYEYMHRKKDDHWWAINLLFRELEDEIEDLEAPEWTDYRPDPDEVASSGNITLYESSDYVLEFPEFEFTIGKQSDKKWRFLKDLTEGKAMREAVERHYESGGVRQDIRELEQDLLIDGEMPEKYREDLDTVIDEALLEAA